MRGAIRALVEAIGIDQRVGDREQARALVVIDDDDVEPGGPSFVQRLEGLGTAIYADGNGGPTTLEFNECFSSGP